MTEQEMREVFREMREEPVPADSLARVRMGVEQGVGKRRRWKFAVPLVAAGCIVAGFLFLRPTKVPVRTVEPAQIEIAKVQPPPEMPVRTAPRPRRVRPRLQQAKTVPVLIRIETEDPDVVILLVN
jgi:hypothetical protein